MSALNKEALRNAIVRLPDWIRKDLAGKDATIRARAEEELAAMLAGALERTFETGS